MYNESPIMADAIERLFVSIACLKDKPHLNDGDTKLLSETMTELICRIIEEFGDVQDGIDCTYLNVVRLRGHLIPRSDYSQQKEESITTYISEPWERSLIQWMQRHHYRVTKLAELLSPMDIFEALDPSVRQTSLPHLFIPMVCHDFHDRRMTQLRQNPNLQFKYFLGSFAQIARRFRHRRSHHPSD